MTGHVMEGLLKLSFTPAEFAVWVRDVVKPKMQWHPIGCVLHNTGPMVWPGFDSRGNKITPAQRMENMSVDWVSRGFTSAPHVLVSPDGMVHVVWPLWLHGTHSPSWNATHFGIEMVGDFDREAFPDKMRESALAVIRTLYGLIPFPVTSANFHFHGEDPRTTHKNCPGKNVGAKASWLLALAGVKPVIVGVHKHNLLFSAGMKAKLKSMEDFREKAYLLKGIWHVGWGFRDGFKGLKVDANTTMTLWAANKLFDQSTDEMADTIQMIVGVPLKQYQLDALGLFCWNLGTGVLQPIDKVTNSKQDSPMVKMIKAGDFAGAGARFELYNKWRPTPDAPLEVSPQLSARRKYERSVFDGKVDLNPKPVIVPAGPQAAPKPVPVVVVAKPVPTAQAKPAPKPVAVPKPIQQPVPLLVRFLQWLLIQLTKP